MKKIFLLIITLLFVTGLSESQTRNISKEVNRAPYFSVAPYGGAIFPINRALRDVYKPGWSAGIDLMYRINKEVGIWGNASYNQITQKTAADAGHYFEGSIGPRYFFTHPKLRSQIFVEAGVGIYNLNQDANLENTTSYILEQIDGTKAGVNGGIGATLQISKNVSILAKVRYHTVFGTNENISFMNGGAGLEFRFR